MTTQSDFVKIGGFFGFSVVFLTVLLKNRDIVTAVMDASIACVVMAFAFKKWYDYTIHLEKEVKREKRKQMAEQQEEEKEGTKDPTFTALGDRRAETS